MIGMISKHQKKNTIILAFVISVCLVLTLYSLGFISMLKKVVAVAPSLPTASSDSQQQATQHQQSEEEEETKHTSSSSLEAAQNATKDNEYFQKKQQHQQGVSGEEDDFQYYNSHLYSSDGVGAVD